MILLKHMLILFAIHKYSSASTKPPIAKPDCKWSCGGIDIPYPFGIGDRCALGKSFEVTCNTNEQGVEKPYLLNYELLSITLVDYDHGYPPQARINVDVAMQCTNGDNVSVTIDFTRTRLRISPLFNIIISTGCGRIPVVSTQTSQIGCFPFCSDTTPDALNKTCNGTGCCQTTIFEYLNFANINIANIFYGGLLPVLSNCSYAAIVENSSFQFNTSYLTTKMKGTKMPLVLTWDIEEDITSSDNTRYCYPSSFGNGYYEYFCYCLDGFEGNPYLPEGCYDINECDVDKGKCPKNRKCQNTNGSYLCSCPLGMRPTLNYADPTAASCQLSTASIIALSVGGAVSLLILLYVGLHKYLAHATRKKKKIKEDYFNGHGGWILYEGIIKSNNGVGFSIFTKEEVEQATNKFDSTKIIGQGGQGTVYKGILRDHEVAIKLCKIIDEKKKKEFGKEMVILSQVNHKNIVKLLGCCLEVHVPMLVYEFISNGTLFQNLHGKNHVMNLSFENCLRIAQESAEALAYLHSSTSIPIHHGDVKSSNILLDENYTAKVSDFGASILAPNDEAQFVTLVQGTCGYLDPEYLITCQLTDKSDVYSFGVVILELLTGKLPIYFDKPEDEKVLSSCFLMAMEENKLLGLLDDQIKMDEKLDLIMEVAELAKECLNIKREERPTMKEVAERLEKIRKFGQWSWAQGHPEVIEEIESLIRQPSYYADPGTKSTSYFSVEMKSEDAVQ